MDPGRDATDTGAAAKEISWLRGLTSMSMLRTGVLDGDAAARAIAAGAQGIVVSNREARPGDPVAATIDALPGVVARVAGRVPVLIEGGIRRGTDILKALGLGAAAVLIGRPALQGLALNGAAGVAHVVRILRRELEMAMASTGRPTVGSIDASVIWR
jgi:4-hydroxymandelate oxidase